MTDALQTQAFDLILRRGTVIDGSSAPRFLADVGIRGDRIAAVGALDTCEGKLEIDADGLIAAPGFIDSHTHDDSSLLLDPAMPAKLSQGVTTVITGNCHLQVSIPAWRLHGIPSRGSPHPRLWGIFTRVLGHYSRDVGLFSLETAVHKMTGLPARQFKLAGRGAIRPGAFADLTIFNAAKTGDRATWEEPTRPSDGIDTVIVNGRISWQGAALTGERNGRVLRHSATGIHGPTMISRRTMKPP